MVPFTFSRARDEQEAIRMASESADSKFLAGGTNLIDLMKLHIERPSRLVDLNRLSLSEIRTMSDGTLRIGAMARNSDMAYHPAIAKQFPLLKEAILSGASAQLRNMATAGGNLLQRTRCPYFYDPAFACNKRNPGSGCDAIKGFNRVHAILGTSDKCIATHPSDMAVALVAIDAVVVVKSNKGERKIPLAAFHLLPGNTPEKETALEHGELITAIDIPPLPFAVRSHYIKVRDRSSYDFALSSAAVALDIANGTIRQARIALGGVGTKPWRAEAAEKILAGGRAEPGNYHAAADAVVKDAVAHEYNGFKIELIRRTLVRALTITGGMS